MEELKPCPFCGSAKIGSTKIQFTGPAVQAYCIGCHARGPFLEADQDVDRARDLWNRRPSTEPDQSWLREACERVLASAPHMSDAHRRKLVEAVGLELARAHARARHELRSKR